MKFIIFFIFVTNISIESWKNIFRKNKRFTLNNTYKKYIISSSNNKIYTDNKIFIDENKLSDKKLITVSPGGFKGFYLLGILTYIKENYDTENLIYSGASAGAWNSLFMCYKGDPITFVYNILDSDIKKIKSIKEIQKSIKCKLLHDYNDNDFDFTKLFIGVTTFRNYTRCIYIYYDFETLEDAINYCIASSHIPLITGGITNKFNGIFILSLNK
jgi:hypothetical protein